MLAANINIQYIADHITRIETRYVGKPHLIHDSLYRIASNADILKGAVITESERVETLAFIEQFKASPEGKEALEHAQESLNPKPTNEDEELIDDIILALTID